MAEKLESLNEIKAATAEVKAARKPSRDKQGRSYATGKRKDAVARVWVKPGKGNITINDKSIDQYFARPVLKMIINQPFEVANRVNEFDVVCTVKGGGLSGSGRRYQTRYRQSPERIRAGTPRCPEKSRIPDPRRQNR